MLAVDTSSILTAQERQFVMFIGRGYRPSTAAREAGYSPTNAPQLLQRRAIALAVAEIRELQNQQLSNAVTRENLTVMLFEAHAKAGSATEEIAAIREIGKMNGLYAPEKVQHEVTENQLEQLSDQELMRLASMRLDSVSAEDADFAAIEAEVFDAELEGDLDAV